MVDNLLRAQDYILRIIGHKLFSMLVLHSFSIFVASTHTMTRWNGSWMCFLAIFKWTHFCLHSDIYAQFFLNIFFTGYRLKFAVMLAIVVLRGNHWLRLCIFTTSLTSVKSVTLDDFIIKMLLLLLLSLCLDVLLDKLARLIDQVGLFWAIMRSNQFCWRSRVYPCTANDFTILVLRGSVRILMEHDFYIIGGLYNFWRHHLFQRLSAYILTCFFVRHRIRQVCLFIVVLGYILFLKIKSSILRWLFIIVVWIWWKQISQWDVVLSNFATFQTVLVLHV